MKLSSKIVFGFVAISLIYVTLSVFIFVLARPVREDSRSLSRDLLPMLEQASQVQYAVAMESGKTTDYSRSINAETWVEALSYSADVVKYLWFLDETVKRTPDLQTQAINESLAKLRSSYQEFRELAELLPPQLKVVNSSLEGVVFGQEAFNEKLIEGVAAEEELQAVEIRAGAAAESLAKRAGRLDRMNELESVGNALVVGAIRARDGDAAEFERCRALGARALQLCAELGESADDNDARATAAAISAMVAEAGESMKLLEDSLKQAAEESARRDALASAVIRYAADLRQAANQRSQAVADDATSALNKVITSLLIGVAAALLLSLALGFLITRGITRPINALIARLSDGAQEVDHTAGELSAASSGLASGATENAGSLQNVSAALEELSSMTNRNADNSVEANSLMSQARDAVLRAEESMARVTKAMGEISTSGNEIAKIIKTIDEIAFQTNLLALNAAVEAARAGEAGSGFAVVADEVRNLATRSAEAARNTADLIDATINNIVSGSSMVEETAESFGRVGGHTGKVAELVGEVAEASREQSQGINQINDSMIAMDKVTQSNAAAAEQSAGAAGGLSTQAAQLLTAVDDLRTLIYGAKG